jgi:hypothetical protein
MVAVISKFLANAKTSLGDSFGGKLGTDKLGSGIPLSNPKSQL